jgi:hypothetical protein
MLVQAEKEEERNLIKKILSNHGIDSIVSQSVVKHLIENLEIQRKKK